MWRGPWPYFPRQGCVEDAAETLFINPSPQYLATYLCNPALPSSGHCMYSTVLEDQLFEPSLYSCWVPLITSDMTVHGKY